VRIVSFLLKVIVLTYIMYFKVWLDPLNFFVSKFIFALVQTIHLLLGTAM